jgi:subtilisin family serine protease
MTIRFKMNWLLLVFLLLIPSEGFASGKLDPMFSSIMRKGADLQAAKRRGLLKSVPENQEPVVNTLVRFEGDLSGVEALGGKVGSIVGDVATVEIPLGALEPLSQLPNIVYVEAPRRVRPRLDLSVPATGANFLRSGTPPNWTGNTGRNVIVGIVDSGLDLNHADFKDASGKSRVLFLRFQTTIFGGQFTVNQECTGAQIDSGDCLQGDSLGHGTHVAGIAAGNGSATGNGQAAYRYIGMAPEADLIIVNALTEGATNIDIQDGIAYIQQKAAALGKPSVINLSLGSDLGPHDGTSNYERAIDNASGPGRIIVSSAGNEGDPTLAPIHASGTVTQTVPNTVEFTIPPTSSGEFLDIWYSGADQMGISVANTNGTCTTTVASPGAFPNPSCSSASVSSPAAVNPQNGDREIQVFVGTPGSWTFTLSGVSISNGRFDAWFEFGGNPNDNVKFTTDVNPNVTLVDSATATRAIAVGAFVTKRTSINGGFTVSAIAPFSSRGPRRSCINTAQCPSVQKPEITAPGSMIMSALSTNAPIPSGAALDPDGVHQLLQGTSMSAPHVTGAVALLLQADPTLTPEEIKEILRTTASIDGFTGQVPNDTWGYGKLNVQAAFAAVPNSPPSSPAGLAATPGDGSMTLSWSANPEVDLDGYNLYRSETSGTGYVKVAFISHRASSFTDTGLQEIPYYYVLRSVDTAGQESVNSPEAVGTPGAAPAGGGGGCTIGSGGGADLGLTAILAFGLLGLGWRGLCNRGGAPPWRS